MGNAPSSIQEGRTKKARGANARPPTPPTPPPKMAHAAPREPHVTVHRPGHMYSHSLDLKTERSMSQDSDAPPLVPANMAGTHNAPWGTGRAVGPATTYAMVTGSDLSLPGGLTHSPAVSDRDDSSAGGLDTLPDTATPSDSELSEALAHSSLRERAGPFRFARIGTSAEHQHVEPSLRTPKASEFTAPGTPRPGDAGAPSEGGTAAARQPAAHPSPPHARRDASTVNRLNIPHRASLIISDDMLVPHTDTCAPSSDEPDTGTSESSGTNERRLSTVPSYLKIPTAIPSSYTCQDATSSSPGGSAMTSLDIWQMPMYSGSGTESTAVHSGSHEHRAPERGELAHAHSAPPSTEAQPVPIGAQTRAHPSAHAEETPTAARADSAAHAPTAQEQAALTPVNLMWRGKGRKVFVTGTFADEWRSKIPLRQLRPETPFICTLHLPRGTHRLKFIVDDRWRVSNELNTASDGDGNLVNYVEIAGQERMEQRAASAEAHVRANPRFADPAWVSAMTDLWRQQQRGGDAAPRGDWDELGDDPHASEAVWTSEVPPSIELAQDTEEALQEHELDADANALLPSPPMLPRQLEKVILNASPANIADAAPAIVDDNSVLPAPNHAVLNHLAASAIKNGVLAIGTVTRYKRKYVTTLLYRPV
ncbi:hypothetical protein MSPP1_003874 [Malassezia sp. CBS 17886]|nr:hypothetical protein MSPP1_003874 [Malassezia sp. CBS 17886]